MDRIQFDKLDTIQQVEYINNMLENTSLTKACNDIGIDRNTIKKRFIKLGYTLNQDINKYVVTQETTSVITTTTKPGNTSQNKPTKKTNNTNTKDDRYKALECQIKDLQNQINSIMNRLDNNVVTQETTSIIHKDIDSLINKETSNRSYRIYNDIQEEFKTFCINNRQHKVQDILSSALREYLDKHNKQ